MAFDKDVVINSATVEEKVSLLGGKGLWRTAPIARLEVPSIVMTDGTHGVVYIEAQIDQGQSWSRRDFYENVRRSAADVPDPDAEQTRTPGLYPFGKSRPVTCFPNASSLACSWDPDLARRMGEALAEECLEMGVSILLGPGINIRRTPLAGRSYEYYSEDPFLTGEFAAGLINGLQSKGVGACLKHFACNNSEIQRTTMDSVVEERALREIYLDAFRRVIKKADPWLLMTSYNRLNGIQASEHQWLLDRVLRKEWGYEGVVISDWWGTKNRVASLLAGNDLSMPEHFIDKHELLEAVNRGIVPMEVLDRAVARTLDLVAKATANKLPGYKADYLSHHRLAQQIAAESIVLLKNENDVLPLRADRFKRVAVVGGPATTPIIQGSGCATTAPWMLDRPLDEIVEVAGDHFFITYAMGTGPNAAPNEHALREAVELAQAADVAVLFISTPIGEDGENGDRENLSVLASHEALLYEVSRVQKNVVVVLANSDSVIMPWLPHVSAVLDTFYAGQGMGRAVAEILFGVVNPSGKLTTTVPNTLEETPAFLSYPGENSRHLYSEGIYVGYRYYDRKQLTPLFPFGFGLSYTEFKYQDMRLSDDTLASNGELTITVELENVGVMTGKEIVQLYVEPPKGRLPRAARELKGFAKLEIMPNETKSCQIILAAEDLAYYDTAVNAWVVEPGEYRLMIGKSSRQIELTAVVQVSADRPLPALKEDSSLLELLEHPEAFRNVCVLYSRKSGKSFSDAEELIKANATDIFTGIHISLTTIFEIDISRAELAAAIAEL
ncbi:beta-glucosidase family protein [Burkholderia sp. LMG 21824]|uniref:beta-glucosidase family protein n=1 Tax=Burkholderia sp. LMG 21824 TaxID=3158172 RepID=UPI003C2FC9F5